MQTVAEIMDPDPVTVGPDASLEEVYATLRREEVNGLPVVNEGGRCLGIITEADLVIGCDAIVTAHKSTLAVMREGRTFVAMNTHGTPTAAFVRNPDWQFPAAGCDAAVQAAVGAAAVGRLDAESLSAGLLGDSIYTNPLMLGYAWQRGQVPLERAALMRAIELNGVQVGRNKAAFEWGRRAAHDLAAVQALLQPAQVIEFVRRPGLQDIVERRVEFLTAYQNAAYAARYGAMVDRVRLAEAPLHSSALSEAVARYLFKLMAYKDEYEVARLHTDSRFTDRVAAMFEGDYKLVHQLAPPMLARTNARGEAVKRPFGPWVRHVFAVLARLKGLRGTPFDRKRSAATATSSSGTWLRRARNGTR